MALASHFSRAEVDNKVVDITMTPFNLIAMFRKLTALSRCLLNLLAVQSVLQTMRIPI